MTVEQYQKVYAITKSDAHELDKMTNIAAVISGKSHDDIEAMDLKEFRALVDTVEQTLNETGVKGKPKQQAIIAGKKYVFILNPGYLKAWQVKKFYELLKGDRIENLHRLIALITRPVVRKFRIFSKIQSLTPERYEQICEVIKKAEFNDINNICNYFIKLWNLSYAEMKPVIKGELIKQGTPEEEAEMYALAAIKQGMIR